MVILEDNKSRPRIVKFQCDFCQNNFIRSAATKPKLRPIVFNQNKHYCSLKCFHKVEKPKVRQEVSCDLCKKKFSKVPSAVCVTNFCSKQCFNQYLLKDPRRRKARKPLTKKHKDKISKANKGKKRSSSVKKAMSKRMKGSNHPFFGQNHTKETKLKISKANLGKKHGPMSQKQKDKISEALKGRVVSADTCRKISQNHADVSKDKNPMWGKSHTNVTKYKISKSRKGKLVGAEHHWYKEPKDRKTKLYPLIRTSTKYKNWRNSVYKRDNYTCVWCKSNSTNNSKTYLNADHVKSFALLIKENNIKTLEQAYKCPELWDIDNGRTLCVDCHKLTNSFAKPVSLHTLP